MILIFPLDIHAGKPYFPCTLLMFFDIFLINMRANPRILITFRNLNRFGSINYLDNWYLFTKIPLNFTANGIKFLQMLLERGHNHFYLAFINLIQERSPLRFTVYRIVRCLSRDFQMLIWDLKTYLGLYTEYEMLIIELKLMINISYSVYRPRYVFRAQISV